MHNNIAHIGIVFHVKIFPYLQFVDEECFLKRELSVAQNQHLVGGHGKSHYVNGELQLIFINAVVLYLMRTGPFQLLIASTS